MGTFDISHPDIADFIRAKREDRRLRQFNLSCLITDEFMQAVKQNGPWDLAFPANQLEYEDPDNKIVWHNWPATEGYITNSIGQVACRVYKTIPGAPALGPDHGFDLRLCRARVHPRRPH